MEAEIGLLLMILGVSHGRDEGVLLLWGGDSPQYSWTLDGRTLTDAELLSGNTETNSITLKQKVSGRLVCSVRNQVSNVSEEKTISTCGFIFINCTLTNGTHISQRVFAANNTLCQPTTTPATTADPSTVDHSLLICGVRAAVVVLALIGIIVYFAWKERKYKMVRRKMDYQENSVVMVEMRS
ncbi:hypothetical protein EPR50_G00108510 [Perca flavescens]|uniref:Ig-like domain-containing protein n=1 Tax=Perca flavescens TaxID=8167 RepID=A0A484CY79_PERFV|nr:hypothetical protein EPR50_G00108510 [Perca flavescens]